MNREIHDVYKKARVRIHSCSNPISWYYGKIGEEFNVEVPPSEKVSYFVNDGVQGRVRLINREDAELIEYTDEKEEKDELNLIANLAKEVGRLKARVRTLEIENTTLENDLRTWAERTEEIDHKAEMLIDDVVMLDERTRDI